MKSPLHSLFAFVGSFGLIGPHSDHEVDLLLAGRKPLGLICIFNSPVEGLSPLEKQDREDVARLDEAVETGALSKCTVHIPIGVPPGSPTDGTCHLYCQRGLEDDLQTIADFHRAIWEDRPHDAELPKDIGFYFGYTEADVALFQRGGYEALPLPLRVLMQRTHEWRKAARLRGLLGSGADKNATSPPKP